MRTLLFVALSNLSCITGACAASSGSPCALSPEIYKDWKLTNQSDGVRDTKALIAGKYLVFFRELADAWSKEERTGFVACAASAKDDPIAARMVPFIRYVQADKTQQSEFVASFPSRESQLADFFALDTILALGKQEQKDLPGISLPDGLVDKFITELFQLVLQDVPGATEKYFFIYGHSNGEYVEFMDEEVKTLLDVHPDLVLKHWSVVHGCRKQLVALSEDNPPEFSTKIIHRFQDLCKRENDESCRELIAIFR